MTKDNSGFNNGHHQKHPIYGSSLDHDRQIFAILETTTNSSEITQKQDSWQLPSNTNTSTNADATFTSPGSLGSFGDIGDLRPKTCLLTPREAVLMRNFIENMALWV